MTVSAPRPSWPPKSSAYAPRIPARNHRLRAQNGTALPHRLVLDKKIGPGSHNCHWCQDPIAWRAPLLPLPVVTSTDHLGRKHADIYRRPSELVTDHVDGHGRNNGRKNLVPSCRGCNEERAHAGNPRWFRVQTKRRAFAQVGRLLGEHQERQLNVLRSLTDTSLAPDAAPIPVPDAAPVPQCHAPPPLTDQEYGEASLDIEKSKHEAYLWTLLAA